MIFAALGPCHDSGVTFSPEGNGHAPAGPLGLTASPFAEHDQGNRPPLKPTTERHAGPLVVWQIFD